MNKYLLCVALLSVCVLLASCATQLGPANFPTASRAEGSACHAEALRYLQFDAVPRLDRYNAMLASCLEGKGHRQVGGQ